MKRETIYSLESIYRGTFAIDAFTFGDGDPRAADTKSIAVVGALRGNEVQQLYVASRLVQYLRKFEEGGLIAPDGVVRVIPCGNPFSLNTKSRFWAVDSTDINRMFPGYDKGETTQRIADGIFSAVRGFDYGVQLTSSYLPGERVPHVHLMDLDFGEPVDVSAFGLPYAIVRKPEPVDVGTLDYNWQLFNTRSISLVAPADNSIDAKMGDQLAFAVLRFMTRVGILEYDLHGGYTTTVVKENHLIPVRSAAAGLVNLLVEPGDHVETGQELASIFDPYTGELMEKLTSPVNGVIFFSHSSPLVSQDAIVFRIINDAIMPD